MQFQLGSSLLDACVLSVLHDEDTYGYKLTQRVKEVMDISESTLYPVLRRLTKDGFLKTYDEQFEGRNRRYYTLTEEGKKQYLLYIEAWDEFSTKIDKIMRGELKDVD